MAAEEFVNIELKRPSSEDDFAEVIETLEKYDKLTAGKLVVNFKNKVKKVLYMQTAKVND